MTRYRAFCIVLSAIALMSAMTAFQRLRVFINGKETNQVMVSNNRVYVSVAALREAGAVVTQSGDRLEIQFDPMLGRLQGDMIEGRIDEWLSNGTWRIRVSKVVPIENPFGGGPGYAVTIEVRNLTKKAISLHETGFDICQFQDDKGNKLVAAADAGFNRIYDLIVQADGFKADLRFGDPANQLTEIGQPEKLIILFRSGGDQPALRGFRIFLKEDTKQAPE